MEGETSNPPTEIIDLRRSETPKPPSQGSAPRAKERRPLEDVLANSSTTAIRGYVSSINQGAMDEARKTEQFRRELRRKLFRVVLSTYSWSSARLACETDMAERRLEQGVRELISVEREQGRSSPSPPPTLFDRVRARLAELFQAVNRAVAAFALP